MGKKVIYLTECHSTNDIATQILDQPAIPEGTLVITDRQTKGRGQRGNEWLSEPGKNLTFSIVLRPAGLSPDTHFHLNMAIALGVYDTVARLVGDGCRIKWPNDVLVHGRKVAGILIENHWQGRRLRASVAGVGLNVNQEHFPIPTATSLSKVAGGPLDLQVVLETAMEALEYQYLRLMNSGLRALADDYLSRLFRIGEPHQFTAQGTSFTGVITGVDQHGRLQVLCDGVSRLFGAKEIGFVYDGVDLNSAR